MDPTQIGYAAIAGLPNAICQRRILSIKWDDHTVNTKVAGFTTLEPISKIVLTRRSSLFGRVVRLAADTPANHVWPSVV